MSDLRRTKSRVMVVLFAVSRGAGASASHTKLCSANLAASAADTTCPSAAHDVSRRGVLLHTATALASGIVPSAAHADGDEQRQKYFLRFPTLFAPLYGESSRRTIKRQLGDRIWALEQPTIGRQWGGGRHLLSSPVRRSSRTSSSGRSRRLCAAWWSGCRMALCGSTRRSRRRGSSSSSSSRARRSAVPPALVPLPPP